MARARELRNRTPEPAAAAKPGHLDLEIGGMTCAHCPPLLERALKEVDGVGHVQVNPSTRRASVDYDRGRTSAHDVLEAIRAAGFAPGTAKLRVGIKGMHCASCVSHVERALKTTPGVLACSVSLGSEAADIVYLPEKLDRAGIDRAIEESGYQPVAEVADTEEAQDAQAAEQEREYRTLMHKFRFAAAVSVPVMGLSYPDLIPGLREWMAPGTTTRTLVWACSAC